MHKPAHVGESGPRARIHELQNSGSQMFKLKFKTLKAQIATGEFPKKIGAIQKR